MALNVTSEDLASARLEIQGLSLLDVTENDLAMSLDKLAFQGFDPILLAAYLKKLATSKGISAQDHSKNMLTLAIVGTMRGSKLSSIASKSSPEAKAWLGQMAGIYNIISTKPTSNISVTLLRIAAIYAGCIVRALSSGMDIRTTVSAQSIHPQFPQCMCISTFASLIPHSLSEDDGLLLLQAYLYHQYKFDATINTVPSSLSKLEQYAKIQVMSVLFAEETRVQTLVGAGLLVRASGAVKIAEHVKVALRSAQEAWIRMT